jgi:two-component system sensor histidine kinase TctE
LLALTRAENQGGAARAVFETIDLRQAATEAMQELAPLALDKGLEIEFDCPQAPLQVRGNALLLHELVKNLLHNAITYTPPGGSVSLRLRRAMPDSAAGAAVVLQVDDTGPGIPEAERALVFEPFYRILDNGSEGSGLGLAIVREIARQHQASVTLNDLSPGAVAPGLRVQLVFPAA